MRENPLFMRNNFESRGKYGFALIKKQVLNTDSPSLIACSDTRSNDNESNKKSGVHFFVDDYRFSGIYDNPQKSLNRYSQYSFLLSPDFSTYAEMDLWRQIESVAKKPMGRCLLAKQRLNRHSDNKLGACTKLRFLLRRSRTKRHRCRWNDWLQT